MGKRWLSVTLVSLLILILNGPVVYAGQLNLVDIPQGSIDLSDVMEYWIDQDGNSSISDVSAKASLWQQLDENKGVNFGFIEKPLWLRFDIQNTSSLTLQPLLVLAAPTLDFVEIYIIRDDGVAEKVLNTGNAYPYHSRLLDNRNFVLPLNFAPDEYATVYVRAREGGSMQVPLALWNRDAYYVDYQYDQTKYALYFGLLLTLMAYNLFLALTLRSKGHSYYVGYIATLILIQASQTGLGPQFLWPETPIWGYLSLQLGVAMSVICAGLFSIEALGLTRWPRLLRWNKVVITLATLIMVSGLILPLGLHLKLVVALGMAGSAAFLVAGLLTWSQGELTSRLYTLAWVALAVGTTIYGANKFGWIPANPITNNAFWLGSAVEGLLLSFSLAARFSALQKHRLELQRQIATDREKQFELESTAIEAEAQNRARGEFIATFSHEIRTPLNGILGMTELLQDTELETDQRSYLDAIKGSGENLMHLINGVLDFSKIEAGRLELDLQPTALKPLVNSCCELFNTVATDKGIGFGVRYKGNIPHSLMLDPLRVKQILINLLSNAFKFTDKGSVELAVMVTDQQKIRFEVTDSGIGIQEEYQQMLFQSFYQGDKSTTRRYGGTGLGLAICQSLVELHEGTIGVTSAPECGSTFWFEVPMVVVEEPEGSYELSQVHEERQDESIYKPDCFRVLVAEDNKVNAMVIERFLETFGCESTFCSDGQEVLAAYMQAPDAYKLILLDYEMPVMDGCQATIEIRNHEVAQQLSPVPIIGISAHTLPETEQRLRDAGMNDFLHKPINRQQFEKLLIKYSRIENSA
ncbi:hybrid sensor histidine kinase/response regulator [Hahella ganghwensis]|uniref:hybrid sensor histidine kinase/response regulator n=1 Tax=Hahella ganghwensis TaxID=286420 RepID=UPI00035EC9B8|nr:hybrid sensor histidine kinase/response regulator [Hahella ganghwensis]